MSHLNLYSCTASKETVDKSGSLTLIEAKTGNFIEAMDLLNPVFQVRITASATSAKILQQCNYVYCEEFGRYYFVTGITMPAKDVVRIECAVDVLMSWKTAILAQKVIVSRNEKEYALYLDDSALKVYNNPNITVYHFKDSQGDNTGFSTHEYILALAGS